MAATPMSSTPNPSQIPAAENEVVTGQPSHEPSKFGWHEHLVESLGDYGPAESFKDNVRLNVESGRVYATLEHLKTKAGFDMLADLAGIDYLEYPDATDRYAVVYALLNTATGDRLFVKTFVNDPDPVLPSVVSLWRGADWLEREVFDLFGVRFDGHPDLRRILMPEEFAAFPLRKDYPLRGRGERHNLPVITRAES